MGRADPGGDAAISIDHGWQTKLTPDSRALISLGLGPNHTQIRLLAAVSPAAAPQYQRNQPPRHSRPSRETPWLRFIPFRSRLLLQVKQKARAIARAFWFVLERKTISKKGPAEPQVPRLRSG